MANCSDNSYVIYYTNLDKGSIQIQKSALDTDVVDIALIGKTRLEYGEVFNENILHLLEHFAAPALVTDINSPDTSKTFGSALEHPTAGQIWYNRTANRPYVYGTDGSWKSFGDINDAAGNSGVIAHGQFLPLPIAADGYTFAPEECVWTVSPFSIPSEIDFMHCFSDPNAKVTMQYRLEGDISLTDGFANYQILGIRGNVNLGTIECQSGPAPTTTPLPSVTMTPSVTPTHTVTPSITPSVTLTVTPNMTPSVTPTITVSPSLSATPTPTAEQSKTATPVPTQTTTPTATTTPTITPSHTVTPTVTPSQPFNDGDVFAVGVRPFGDYILESYYVRKMRQNGLFNTFQQTTLFPNTPTTSVPSQSAVGSMYKGWYMTAAGINLYAFGVNLTLGVYGNTVYTPSNPELLPVALTSDTDYFYVASVNLNPSSANSQVEAYTYNGYTITPAGLTLDLSNQTVTDIYYLGNDSVLVITTPESDPTATALSVGVNDGVELALDGFPETLPIVVEAIAVRDANNIALIDGDNAVARYTYSVGNGIVANGTPLSLAAYTSDPINALKYDKTSGNLYVVYTPISDATKTALLVIEPVGFTVASTIVLPNKFVTETKNSIAVFEDKVLMLSAVDVNNPVLTTVGYSTAGGFTLIGAVSNVPVNREVQEVAFILPNLPRPTPTPTPTPTNTVTPSVTPTLSLSATPTRTPSPSVSTTPPGTPPSTPPSTPAPTPSTTPPAPSSSDPCGGLGCPFEETPNCGCPVGCTPIDGGCRCGGQDQVCP